MKVTRFIWGIVLLILAFLFTGCGGGFGFGVSVGTGGYPYGYRGYYPYGTSYRMGGGSPMYGSDDILKRRGAYGYYHD